jgi:hypothetical protein
MRSSPGYSGHLRPRVETALGPMIEDVHTVEHTARSTKMYYSPPWVGKTEMLPKQSLSTC